MYLFSFLYFSLYEKKLWTYYVRIKIQVLLWLRSLNMRLVLFLFSISIPNTLLIRKDLLAYAHLKGSSIFLMYDCPKILSFVAAMGLKVHPHFYIVLINTLRYVFVSLFPTTTYLSLSQVCPLFH